MKDVVELLVSISCRPAVLIKGRYTRCLYTLIRAGKGGVSPAMDDPMPRWSHYVFWLRSRYEVAIETVTEKHDGPYAGTYARYVLLSNVAILRTVRHGEARDKPDLRLQRCKAPDSAS
jgi:hypothetical protein